VAFFCESEWKLPSLDKIANLLVLILLVEMMMATGLGVSWSNLAGVVRNAKLLARAGLANYLVVPAAALLLLYLFQAKPLVAVGFLLVAVCPGAPFAPPLTAMAKGNVSVSVGLMAILAASSAILAPLLLSFLLPFIASGAKLNIDTIKILTTLLMTQLLPLGIGLLIRSRRPRVADMLRKPAALFSVVLSLTVFSLIIVVQYRTLAELRTRGLIGICILVLLFLGSGLALGGQPLGDRWAFGLTTAARNVGVALVIATESFPESAAVSAVIVFAIFQIIGLVLIALFLGQFSARTQPL
jgi:BASS family bile acid:Na+ symporter